MKGIVVGLLFLSGPVFAEPACHLEEASNVVIASSRSLLASGWSGQWLLQNVATPDRILLRRCGLSNDYSCYFAVDVAPGRYYFQEVLPSVKNSLYYPVSRKAMWFEISGKGVDYIGDWTITRDSNRQVTALKIRHSLKHLDAMLLECGIAGKKLFLAKTMAASMEIVD